MERREERPPCPNGACPTPHVVRNGSLNGRQRYRCRGCGLRFGATHGTPLYCLKTPPAEIARALLVVMRRGSLRAAEGVWGECSVSLPAGQGQGSGCGLAGVRAAHK